jgi:hypothetical protein
MTQFVPSLTRVADEPAVAGKIWVPSVPEFIGYTLDALLFTSCVVMFLNISSLPINKLAVGRVTVIVPVPLHIIQLSLVRTM